MIEILQALTRDLVLLLLLANFLAMLLPKSDLSRYIKLVVGLFVILAILNPVLKLFESQEIITLPMTRVTRDTPKQEIKEIIDKGRKLQDFHQEKALQVAQKRLEQQVEAMVYLVNGIGAAQVELILANGAESGPEIVQAVITITPDDEMSSASQKVKEVEKVVIGPEFRQGQEAGKEELPLATEKLVERVINGVSAYLSLDTSKVQVIIEAPQSKNR